MFFSIYWKNVYVWAQIYEEVGMCGIACLKSFLRIFVILLNEEVCEIVFSISDITNCEVFTIIMEYLRV